MRPQPAHSTLHRVVVPALVAILLAGGLFARGAASPPPVLGDHCPPGQVHQILGNLLVCVPEGGIGNDFAPDQLLNRGQLNGGRHFATAAQRAALSELMQKAVANTAAMHQVPASELSAVQTWGRPDAQAELWGLVVEAITTPACPVGVTTDCRTPNQQHVVDWMAAMAQRQGTETAIAAGLELVKYSGLSQDGYRALFANGAQPTLEQLTSFLTIEPLNYNSTDPATATGGYCVYRSPAPFQAEYTGYNDITCFVPCPNVAGCDDPMPETAQFLKWGTAAWANGVYDTEEYASATRAISVGIALGGLATAVVGGVTLATTLGAVVAGTSFVAAVFPFAATVTVVWGGYTVGTATITTAASTAAAGALAAGAIAAVFSAVIVFITGTTIRAIDLITDLAVPGEIAKAIVDARTASYDPATMITDDEDHRTLYQLFVGATLPGPLYETCNNQWRLFPVQALCLNAPAIPAATATDPQFVVTDHASADAPASATRISPTISYQSPGINVVYPTETRLRGTWFVHTIGGSIIQSFRIRVADWSGAMHTAWLLKKDSGAYTFFGIPDGGCPVGSTSCQGPVISPATCVADGTCWESTSLEYVGANGMLHTATVQSPASVTWAAPAAITYPTPLTATQLNASAAGVEGTFAYTVDGSPVTAAEARILGGGTYTLGVTFTPAASTGRLPASAQVTLTVNKATLAVTGPATTMPYGGPVPALSPQYGPFVNGDDALDLDTPPTCSTAADGDSPVGTYATSCSGGTDGNYAFAYTPGTLEVTPAPLTVVPSSPFMRYGDEVPAITPVYQGLVSGDTASAVTVAPTCSTTATNTSPVGSYPSSCSGGIAPNYTITHQAGTQTVSLRGLLITPENATKTYGDTLEFDGSEFSATGLVNGDVVTSLTITSTGAAASAPVTPSPYSIVGVDAIGTGRLTNYLILIREGALTVTPAPLTVTASSASMILGGLVPVIQPIFDGLVAGDTAEDVSATSCSTTATSDSALGTYASTCTGGTGSNYTTRHVDGVVTVAYDSRALFDQTRAVRSGATLPIRLQLLDASGANLSSASTSVVLASPIALRGPDGDPVARQPVGAFTFVHKRNAEPIYQFNLRTTGLTRGTHTLYFTVSGDPTIHSVTFEIR
ncbi:MAG TPA: MBG domain-containing protein [Patescibacteria group bacterium]|nr:MBG domain-containing protein [Patescibacteria group bacterium]